MNPRAILEKSVLIATREEIFASVDRMAAEINAYYGDREIILLAVMTGAILPATWIASRLTMPLRMDFVHATRYSGQTEGGQLEFRVAPRLNLQDQEVLIVDDIYDVGLTLELIERYCLSRGARSVNSAVLVRRCTIAKPQANCRALSARRWQTSMSLVAAWMCTSIGGISANCAPWNCTNAWNCA